MNFLVGALLFLLPLHAFLITWSGQPSLAFWKEFILLLILILSAWNIFRESKREKNLNLIKNRLLWLIIAYVVFATSSTLWAPPDSQITRLIYGVKYELMPFIVLGIGIIVGAADKINYRKALKFFYYGGGLAILFGLIIQFIIGPENLVWFGYGSEWSTYTPGKALAFCHKIENTNICRFQATLAGPNQAAFYILVFLPFAFREAWQEKSWIKYLKWILVTASLFSLYLTYSRSAWLGLISMIGIWGMYKIPKEVLAKSFNPKLLIFGGIGLIATIALILWQMGDLFQQIVLRVNSTSEHVSKWIEGFNAFKSHPWIGQGIASSGPAARRMMDFPLIPESWSLQVLINTGLIGFTLFISTYGVSCWNLWKIKKEFSLILLLILLSLIVPMQVLHVFEDSSLTYSLFLLCGLYLGQTNGSSIKK